MAIGTIIVFHWALDQGFTEEQFRAAALTTLVVIHALALQWGPTQFILRVEPIGGEAWLRIVLIAATVIVVSEMHKLLRRDEPAGRP